MERYQHDVMAQAAVGTEDCHQHFSAYSNYGKKYFVNAQKWFCNYPDGTIMV